MLIIVLPIAIMQVAVMWAFFDRHWVAVTSRLSESVAGDIAVLLDLYREAPSDERLEEIKPMALKSMSLSIALEPEARLPNRRRSNFFRVLDRTLRRALTEKLDSPFWFDTTRYPIYVEILIKVDDGVLRIIAPRDRVFASTGHIFLLWIIGASTLLTAVSLAYIRNQVKPIERLAAAADRFGRGLDAPEFKPAGATEVRQAAAAFQDMRKRIERHIAQRTTILAGVSHDLRTPLTRFRLQLALLPEGAEREAMMQDVADMEAVLDEYLAFARGVTSEDVEPVNIVDLLGRTARDHGISDDQVELELTDDIVVFARPTAIRRCLDNLIENAFSFGDEVRLTAAQSDHSVEITIDDNGPGIPYELREEAFKPFNQLDRSGARSGNRMGYGLGLAIARDLARGHGGDVILGDSPLGGLQAKVRLPTETWLDA